MMNPERNIAVVYLMWLPYGQDYLRAFMESYTTYPAGQAHTLYILFNGARSEEEVAGCRSLLDSYGHPYEVLEIVKGQDITAYYFAASAVKEEYILFLNTYSRLLAPNWLAKYYQAITMEGVGIVAATGSYQSYYSSVYVEQPWKWEKDKSFNHQFRKYKLFVKAFVYWRRLFKPFPNPHVRTNAFMLRRKLLLSIEKGGLHNKLQAYVFESGRKGLTSQVLAKGLRAVVLDKRGKVYEMERWKESTVFWTHAQDNLLVEDNQTLQYDQADTKRKKELSYLAWGSK